MKANSAAASPAGESCGIAALTGPARLPFLVLLLCALVASSCGGNGTDDKLTTLERIKREGVVRVGYANEAPYAYVAEGKGLTGESPEIARVIFARMGVDRIEGVLTEFGSLIPGLKAGRFDIIAAGMYITPERAKEIAFSQPTYGIGEAFIVQAGNPLDLHSYQDVAANDEATLGVVAGTVERGYARSTGIPSNRVAVFPDAPSAMEGVRAGRVDAYAGTSLTIQYLLDRAEDERIERAEPFANPVVDGQEVRGYGAFGIRQQDHDLLEAINRQLADFIGSEAHQKLVRPFGFTENDLPGDVTTAMLIGAKAARGL